MSRKATTIMAGIGVLAVVGLLLAQGPRGGPGRRGFRGMSGGSFNAAPLAKGPVEEKILKVLDDMDRNQRDGMMNVPVEDGRLLRVLAESLDAMTVVELGTSNGYSAIWWCLALKTTGGSLTTFEIDPGRAALARENFKKAGVTDIVTLIQGDAHEKVKSFKDEIDILFLDADKEGYIDYLNKLLPRVRSGGLIVAHNINPGQADPKYIEAITGNPDLETVFLNHAGSGGVSVTLKKRPLS
jgi:caffeoyl-CoA O-methyltransferase